MFICRAVAGRPAVASAKVSLNAPPYLDTEQMIRFTCVKDARFNPEVYAFFDEKLVYLPISWHVSRISPCGMFVFGYRSRMQRQTLKSLSV